MGALTDQQIEREMSHRIKPFSPMQKREGKISYGVSSMGYDARLGYKFKVFSPANCGVIDPKNFDPNNFIEKDLSPLGHSWSRALRDSYRCRYCHKLSVGDVIAPDEPDRSEPCPIRSADNANHLLIPPNGFVLGETIETFDIPRDILVIVLGKSTYARCGIIINVTPGEPEWVGKWTIEISNTSSLPAKIYPGEGIMQCIFLRADQFDPETAVAKTCKVSYKDKAGKYQDQKGLTDPKVDQGTK